MHEWSRRGGQFEGRWVARMAGVGLIVIWGWGCSGGLGVWGLRGGGGYLKGAVINLR